MATKLTPRRDISDAEWQVRVDLAACYRLCDLYGWSDMTATHISARAPGPEDHFLLNPYGMFFDQITASSLIKVDMQGRQIGNSSYRVNPAGFVIHSAIHMSTPDFTCVMHTHTVANTVVSMQRKGLLPDNQHALIVYGDVAYHGFEGVADRLDERERIVSDLGEKRILLLRNHGALTVGRSVAEAFMATYHLERACQIQLAFQNAGQELSPVPLDVQERTIQRNRKAFWTGGELDAAKHEWPSLIRKLDRIDRSYRD